MVDPKDIDEMAAAAATHGGIAGGESGVVEDSAERRSAPPPGPPDLTWLARLHAWQWPISLVVLAAALLPGLGRAGLLDPWEMDRAAIARRMANPARVMVVEAGAGTLVAELDKKAGGQYQFARAATKGDATALASLQQASQRLTREVAHAIVIDGDALAAAPGWDETANLVASMESQNRGMAVLLATSGDSKTVGPILAKARARSFAQAWRGAGTSGWLDKDSDTAGLWPLFAGSETVVARAQLSEALARAVPSPWLWPVHKRDAQNAAVPWLDAALTAASLRAVGPSELGARLAAALLILLTGLWIVFVAKQLWGASGGWLALLTFATLPSAIGFGRILTFEASPVLGSALVTGALCLAATKQSRTWLVWLLVGFAILLLGEGLAGASVAAAMTIAWVIASGEVRPATIAAAVLTAAGVALAAWVVLGDQDTLLLRGLRFTQVSFSAGPDQYHRDFSWFVGQLGFASFPWGPAVVAGLGALLTSDRDSDRQRWNVGAALLLALAVPFTVMAVLIGTFNHLVLPATGVLALAAASMLVDLLRGRLTGRVAAMFIALATLLLHREIGHGADAVTRFFAFDPPIAPPGGTGNLIWPEELAVPKPLHVLALLATMAFAVGLGKPFAAVRDTVVRLRAARPAGWALGGAALIWGLDALISLGTKLDVLLKTQSQMTNYAYDRLWVTIQDTRPEVMAASAGFALLLLLAARATWTGDRALPGAVARVADFAAKPAIALSILAVGAAMVLGSGLSKLLTLRPDLSGGEVAAAGLGSSAFLTCVALVGVAAAVRLWTAGRDNPDSLLAPLGIWVREHAVLALCGLAALAVAGVGVGASQAAGTWSFPLYLIGCWWLTLGLVLIVAGTARGRAGMIGWPAVAAGLLAMLVLFGPLATRYVQETQPAADAYKYLARVLFAAPDSAAWLGVLALVALNRLAVRTERLRSWLDRAVDVAGRVEQPRWAVAALVTGSLCFAAGYAWTLLPGMSLHFSQKHLLQRIAEAGGAGPDTSGAPRTFAHGSSQTGGDNNFYMQALPIIEDRQAALSLLAGDNVAVRVVDNSAGGIAKVVALPGWDASLDADGNGKRDKPAWFGLASEAKGASVAVAGAAWQPGQWKDAAVFGPAGQTSTVADNAAESLTLAQGITLSADDPTRAWLALDRWGDAGGRADAYKHAAAEAIQRFVILPRDSFSDINHAFRLANAGRHIAVVDDTSSRLVLAATFLQAAQPDRNWLKNAIITQDDVNKEKGLRKMFANFDNAIHLIGYKLADAAVSRSQKYKMTLYWKVVRATTTSWKLFMHPHPLHLDRWPLTQPDPSEDENKPCNGCFQTNHWMVGDIIADSFEQEVPLGTNAGPNEIILGWYNPSSDTRLTLISASGPGVIKHGDNRVTIGHLQVR